ncbi:MAG: purine-nucleoside phosphorylase [Proteobacteria bacterium]|nr:purine-nucleoside phosphorylase [Pseudomonadota bacterium]
MENDQFITQVDQALVFLKERLTGLPEIILVLGTGLGSFGEVIEAKQVIPYEDIPHFPRSTVATHAGNLVCGTLCGKNIAVLQGRFHFYEGYSTRRLTLPVRVLALLGARIFIATNVAGGLDLTLKPGSMMIIRDHLNFIPDNPLRGPNVEAWGPRFPDMSEVYDQGLIDAALRCAEKIGLKHVMTGIYVAIPGPSLETPAETRWLKNCGADAVGMSTVPEVIVARHAGLKILGISLIANVNDPDDFKPILFEEVIAQAKKAERDFLQLVVEVLKEI